jgi:molecular chaperone DnaK (HSP70)
MSPRPVSAPPAASPAAPKAAPAKAAKAPARAAKARREGPHFLVGIDLGTTNTVVAAADLTVPPSRRQIRLFPIEQLIAPGEVAARPLLPSARFHYDPETLPPAEASLPWAPPGTPPTLPGEIAHCLIGEGARFLGAKSPVRLLTSAKSWLCHGAVDRTAAILPWGAPAGVPQVSPLTASASYLAHVRAAWDLQHPEAPLATQEVVLTVPASFDEAARALTVEAARLAGLPAVRLVEEPQAVVYDWLWRHRRRLAEALGGGRLLLVCDVGGGTTDLTLIHIEPGGDESGTGAPQLTRIGVGDHLILGGDNVDLALAHHLEGRLGAPALSPAEFSGLLGQCRAAKEALLAAAAPESAPVTLLGGGRRLVGGARRTELSRAEAEALVLDGFFPSVGLEAEPLRRRAAVLEFGLPYAAEPGITRHVSAFLARHGAGDALAALPALPALPDLLLLNGGMFLSPRISQRMTEVVASWLPGPLRTLDNPHPEAAVAFGAVAYGIARIGGLARIGGGAARSYFLALEGRGPAMGICLLPKGTEEGEEVVLVERRFSLALGRPVGFRLCSATAEKDYRPGEVVPLEDPADPDRFQFLPPLALALARGEVEGKEIEVRLAAQLTEVGTVEIACLPVGTGTRRDLTFELRKAEGRVAATDAATPAAATAATTTSAPARGVLPPRLPEAEALIEQVFGPPRKGLAADAAKGLRAALERCLGPRASWDTALARELFAALLPGARYRRRSPEHERLWLGLTGYCLRPGFGAPLDDWRIDQCWPLYAQGLQHRHQAQCRTEWWTFWRRLAGGLDEARQGEILAGLAQELGAPVADQAAGGGGGGERAEVEPMVRLASTLERVPGPDKEALGDWLLSVGRRRLDPATLHWALGRIGARVPFHASAHQVVAAATAGRWLAALLAEDWKKAPAAAFAAALLARYCGDRGRDLDPESRAEVARRLQAARAPVAWARLVLEVAATDAEEEQRIFGESLPHGLRLLD